MTDPDLNEPKEVMPDDAATPTGDSGSPRHMKRGPNAPAVARGTANYKQAEEWHDLCDKLAEAITTVLDDEETGAGGWGPDVTMAGVLRQALASYREHKGEPPPGKGG